ncbi:hypothetical protein [Archaeoglobus neptunius]|uniref:hypothetical protein n=1 Tax=Archaeoglobus neptunius TaxID=2798580 RepID=UPI0019271883|nr:hypothetical protein [Archaeoglobus neptunius]
MIPEAKFSAALNMFLQSSAMAGKAADNVIAVANVDTAKISEGFNVLLSWALKLTIKIFEEINANPSLKAEMVESQRMLVDGGLIQKLVLVAGKIVSGTGMEKFIWKMLGNFLF